MEKKTIGVFIAVLRKAAGMTQRQFGERLGVSDKAVSRWERDEALPDLTLIPIIADIFGITADELLRGQRRSQENIVPEAPLPRSDKQLIFLIKKTKTDYFICCCISVFLALLGLVAAMLANLGYQRAYIGFFAGCFFFIPAVLFQILVLVDYLCKLDTDELENPSITQLQQQMFRSAEIVLAIVVTLFSTCMPLILVPYGNINYLTARTWAFQGLLCGIIGVIICKIIIFAIRRYQKKHQP